MTARTKSEPKTAFATELSRDHDRMVAQRAFELAQSRGKASGIVWTDWRRAELEYLPQPPASYDR